MQAGVGVHFRRTVHILVGAAIATALMSSVSEAAFPGRNGRIALESGACIKTMKPDGSARRNLSSCRSGAGGASSSEWAPDGRRLLFFRFPPFTGQPAIMRADGSGERSLPIPVDPPFLGAMSFSPDGRHFAFTRQAPSTAWPPSTVWVATLNGRENRSLRAGWLPRWSPNGRTIAYVDPDKSTWLMDA